MHVSALLQHRHELCNLALECLNRVFFALFKGQAVDGLARVRVHQTTGNDNLQRGGPVGFRVNLSNGTILGYVGSSVDVTQVPTRLFRVVADEDLVSAENYLSIFNGWLGLKQRFVDQTLDLATNFDAFRVHVFFVDFVRVIGNLCGLSFLRLLWLRFGRNLLFNFGLRGSADDFDAVVSYFLLVSLHLIKCLI